MARRIIVTARAKLNLGLAVGPRRPDGYHDLATVFQSISLADTLVVEPRRSGFTLEVRHEEGAARGRTPHSRDTSVPGGRDNLVLRAARLLRDRIGLEGGAHFRLVKRIPVRAGLGGGSADGAAAIAGLLALRRVRIAAEKKLEVALELGSDVPFAMRGGTALGLGHSEHLTPLVLAKPFRAIIAAPRWSISTALAFAEIDRRKYDLTAWKAKLRSAQLLERNQLRAEASLRFGNTFEEVLGARQSDFISLVARLREAGLNEVRMTGSGSAIFGVLSPGVPAIKIVGRFVGDEALFIVRSAANGLSLSTLP